MKSLWMIIYIHGQFIGGVAGPLPYDLEECNRRANQNIMEWIVGERTLELNDPEKYKTLKLKAKDVKFECEFHEKRPEMNYKP